MSTHLRRLSHVTRPNSHTPKSHLSSTSRILRTRIHEQPPTRFRPAHPHPLQVVYHYTHVEMVILVVALGILVALLCWLGWKVFTHLCQLIKEKSDDYNIVKRARASARRIEGEVENAPKFIGKFGHGIASAAKGGLSALTRDEDWRRREGEIRGLLGQGQDINESNEAKRYGYYEGTVYQDRASDSTGSGKTTLIHRDDCVGQCGDARKRSIEV